MLQIIKTSTNFTEESTSKLEELKRGYGVEQTSSKFGEAGTEVGFVIAQEIARWRICPRLYFDSIKQKTKSFHQHWSNVEFLNWPSVFKTLRIPVLMTL